MTFDEFLTERSDWLLRFAVVLCGDRGLAEDVVQEVLIRAHNRWDTVSAAASPAGYVRTMIVNEYLSWRRKWARVTPVSEVADLPPVPDPAFAIADRDELRRLLDGLPRQLRAVVVLRYYADLPDAEIAATLGCSPGTVRGYQARALAALRVGAGMTATTSRTER